MDYIAYLHKDQDSDFGVSFPDFPGCVTAGKTLDEARRMAAEALTVHIAGMMEDGDVVPEPSTLDSLADDVAMRGAVAFLVHVEAQSSRTVRVNITAREKQVEEIDRLAAAAGMSRSAYMVRSALTGVSSRLSGRNARKETDPSGPGTRPIDLPDLIAADDVEAYIKKYSRAVASANFPKRKRKA